MVISILEGLNDPFEAPTQILVLLQRKLINWIKYFAINKYILIR